MQLREYERMFKALSDKQRLRILALLSRRPLVVNDIKLMLRLSMPTISQHLSILRDSDLVLDNKQGRWVEYSIHPNLLKTNSLPAIIYTELKTYFDGDETLNLDFDFLDKINSRTGALG
ncbi:MAG: metalloregulator ArsR/SmtB family transcription factor [Spirochaetes bacterium]|nr:metalloregulator ArsR/SmtB family transcription factor [Spirochaetota bacterium]